MLKTVFVCPECGKETSGRLPNIGGDGYGRLGDGTFRYPRRHKVNGKDCPGNIMEAIWKDKKVNP